MKSAHHDFKNLNKTKGAEKVTQRKLSEPAKPIFRSASATLTSQSVIKTQLPETKGLVQANPEFDILPLNKYQWVLKDGDVGPIPIYPLERPVAISDPPQIIATRIADALNIRSVAAIFDGSEAKCKDMNYLQYRVHLFSDNDGKGTIVEVMKYSGCGFEFQREREAVLNSAKGLGAVTYSKRPSMLRIPASLLKNYKPPSVQEQEELVEGAIDSLHSKQQSQQLFALENLAALTAPGKVNKIAALQMSRLILLNNHCDIRSIIVLSMASRMAKRDLCNCQVVNACVNILSNVMSLLSEEEELKEGLEGHRAFVETAVSQLVHVVHALTCPHNTALALKSLSLLLKNSEYACSLVNERTIAIVKNAEKIGKYRHLSLKNEAQSALKVLSCQ